MKKYRPDGFALFALAILTWFAYRWVPRIFFQQDEWYSIGQALLARKDPSIIFHVVAGVHVIPIGELWFNVLYGAFGLEAGKFGIVSVFMHVAVVVAAYLLVRNFRIHPLPAFMGVAFFALNPVSSQVVTWISAATIDGPSVLLFLTGCLLLFMNERKKKIVIHILVFLLLFCSLWAKEDVITGFILLFILWLARFRKGTLYYTPVAAAIVTWAVLYVGIWLFGVKDQSPQSHKTIVDGVKYLAAMPGWMGNIVLTHNSLRAVLQRLTGQYTSYFPFVNDDNLLKFICGVLALIWYGSYFLTVYLHKLSLKKILFFPAAVLISMTPYFLSNSGGLESRHFYIPVLITGIWIAWYLDWLRRSRYLVSYRSALIAVIVFLFVYGIALPPGPDFMKTQSIHKQIVSQMQLVTTPASGTVVYYIQNGGSFTFLSGPGQMLMVLQAIPDPSFLPYMRTLFLWGMHEQGFKKMGNKGFGYYFDFDTLMKDYARGLFAAGALRAYAYDGNSQTFHSITDEVLLQIQNRTGVVQ